MPIPVLHVIAGPNGAGKTTYYETILGPTTRLPFVNADQIARDQWAGAAVGHAYEAARLAADHREELIHQKRSFVTETVFAHPSEVDLVRTARDAGYRVYLHVVLIPEELALARVRVRVRVGGHDVPEDKIRARHQRLWQLVREAIPIAHETEVLDNGSASAPFRRVARYVDGEPVGVARWPRWTPSGLPL